MEEELNYANVTLKINGGFTHEKSRSQEVIYDEVKTGELAWVTMPPDNKKKSPRYTPLHRVVAGLGIICVILLLVVIALSVHFSRVMSEQYREKWDLTAQNLQLRTEKAELERQTEELTREKDGLNWTIGVILEYEDFPVISHCPHRVCKPCQDGWVLFQSSCYLFSKSNYHYYWRTWEGSHEECKRVNADLVVIGSQEEQEFINNHTEYYNDEKHGYWIGLSKKDVMGPWMWVDGGNLTVMYWRTQGARYNKISCVLSLPLAEPLANWHKENCDMRNRWICERRALIKESKWIL